MATSRPCSITDALSVVGEKYALLVLREVLYGNRRFDVIQRNTGAPRDVLTNRLRRLVEAGVLERRRYSERPPRDEYVPTQAGRELRAVLMTLMAWGDRWLCEGEPPVAFEHTCGADLDPVVVCRHCGEEPKPRSLTPRIQAAGWSVAGPVAS